MVRSFIVGLLLAAAFFCWAPSLPAVDLVFSGAETQVSPAAELVRGIEFYRKGEADQALQLLRGLAVQGNEPAVRHGASLYLARIFHDRGQDEEALLYLERIPQAAKTPEAQVVEGTIRMAMGETERGQALLLAVAQDRLSAADRVERFAALAEAKTRLGQPLESLLFLRQALSAATGVRADELLARAHGLLEERLDDHQLAEAAFMFRDTPLGEDALLQQALRAEARGEADLARRLVEHLVAGTTPFPYRLQAVRLWEQLTGKAWLQRAVGVVLPLSGRYANFGELVRRGMDLALELHRGRGDENIRFVYRDGGSDPEQSARAVAELADGERVVAVAGPLTGGAAQAAAGRAQELKVPLLALSQRDGLPEVGDYIFRDSLTSRQQVRALVSYALEEQQLTRFAILSPDSRLGREMAELFVREVEKRGGQVTKRQSYAENATDFRRPIKLLMGEDPDAPEPEPAKPGADIPPPKPLPFDALFIPDYADRISLIAPQLAFYGIDRVALLGISGWNSPDLVRLAGRYVEGAVFVDGFFGYSPYPFVKEFVERYFEKYAEEPSILGAQGFDAANILLQLLDRPEIRSRDDLRLALTQLRNYPGVTGATSFTLQGEAEKVLFLLQIQNGNIVQIN